ncbi:MotA/TolQ/ExbB proton channel family protein [Actinobacillus pleuropneumoniae]|uniref:Biopolymer transport protein ExbB n=2 Tax=Actinobacillus pleuropneumoniae TaxID=715 RepID=A0ABM6X480_ACTPL|nr:MotA/TolQ/ExbB proton channel family protein [Actinobacillus pleuropneumoniae]ASU15418.1 Biopolymer transport protein ExbB [Actinobacillus pleuropneumoniae]AWG95996.1 MotA/TolQ/ExbB proton channel family protein [Actinobacillus pleuropneumoniae serovar 1 str. 4074]AXA22066.1 MotA/TolQ/ExbB proton channel family protein [Actinobacillus pleuropneumoniae]MBL4536455.1 MotA/TolQ/ExbB proton channel family protein [Actinobacillus pleuropneumoniae]MCI1069147.1 MotA/TolQ/ExbB proton channel family 
MNLTELIKQQDIVLSVSFFILVFMSILSWSIILIRLIKIIGVKKNNQVTFNRIKSDENMNQAKKYTQNKRSDISEILQTAFKQCELYQLNGKYNLSHQLPFKDFLTLHLRNAITQSLRKYDGGLVALASIGAVAPFIGLFGTVWGIFNALMDISQQGQVSIATVSAPIGEALVATAMGLFVAIPAVLAYNLIARLNRNLSQDLDHYANELFIYLLHHYGENK